MKFKKQAWNGKAKNLPSGNWRLASVEEVRRHPKEVEKHIVGTRDYLRLLDGWTDGTGQGYCCQEYRPKMKHMLVVETKISRKSDILFDANMYSGVNLSPIGGEVALLLSCEDKMAEVICFVLDNIIENFKDPVKRRVELDRLMESLQKKFREKRTVMHYVADQSHSKKYAVYVAKKLVNDFENGKELVKRGDKHGKTALHFAAFRGNIALCKFLMESCEMKAEDVDQNGENLLHFAVKGKTSKVFNEFCNLLNGEDIFYLRDKQGKTALHKAAAKGRSLEIIKTLIAKVKKEKRMQYIHQGDLLGQTALHEATRGGHLEVVERLLKKEKELLAKEKTLPKCRETAGLLLKRDSDGKTALHCAVQLSEKFAMPMIKSLLESEVSEEKKSLLLWASAAGMGTAEEYLKTKREKLTKKNSQVEDYLKNEREKHSSGNLLESAIKLGHYNMACELVNRGANTAQLTEIDEQYHKRALIFLKQINEVPERGRDQPTINDGLGRKYFAKGLAALFLNPCVKTPVTVGILGDWGMGKSSLMIQTEIILLKMSAQLVFPNLMVTEKFPGSIEIKLSQNGRRKYEKIKNAVKDLKIQDLTDAEEEPLVYFLDNYQQKYHDVYRALALMDRKEMYDVKGSDSNISRYSLTNIPSILAVRYNAWQYQNEREAWAGLAVEIPKAIEESMTRAQKLRCRCKYAWTEHRTKMILELFLPCFLVVLLSGLLLWGLFSRSKGKELVQLKYGSIPLTVLVVVWTIMKQVSSVLKPVSAQIMGYLSVPDHSRNLGYQNQVISDIKFSKEEFGRKPSRFWKFIAWLWSFCGLRPDNVMGTSIPKSPPPCKDNIRMIVFVDDLDRCKDSVVLEVLSAVNLVLTACEINVILGMNKEMIIRAIGNQLKGNKSDAGLAEKYLSKIIQLPLALPDSNNDEMEEFLNQQLGPDFGERGEDDQDSNAKENVVEKKNPVQSVVRPDIEERGKDGQDSNAGENVVEKKNPDGTRSFHWILDIHQTETCRDFSAMLFQYFEPVMRFTNRLFGFKPEDNKSNCRLSTPLKMMMLLPSYSSTERDAITCLSKVAEGFGRLPREWKRFLTYHRVAWNVLSQNEKVRECAGWQVQLLVWIFCCWQWKDEIDKIIENWEKLVPVDDRSIINDEPNSSGDDDDDSNDDEEHDLSLRIIIEHYIEKVEVEAEAEVEPDEGAEVQAEEGTELEAEVDPDEGTEVQAEAEVEPDEGAEVQAEEGIEIEAEVDPDEGAEVQAEEGIEIEAEVEAEEGAGVEAEAETDTATSSEEEPNVMGRGKAKKEQTQEGDKKAGKSKAKEGTEKEKEKGKEKVTKAKEEVKEGKRVKKKSERGKKEARKAKVKGDVEVKGKGDDEKWKVLKDTLIKYDVSMDCILAFQNFRLYCKVKNLPPPSNRKQSKIDTKTKKASQQDPSSSAGNNPTRGLSITAI